jgi:hypothetical protein
MSRKMRMNFLATKKRERVSKGQILSPSHSLSLSAMWSRLGSNQGPPDYESGALTG